MKLYSLRKPEIQKDIKSEDGMILIISLALLAVLALLGTIVAHSVNTDLKISTNYKSNIQAFYIAEAGVEHAKADLINTSFDSVLEVVDDDSDGRSLGILIFGPDTSFASGTYSVLIEDDDDGDDDLFDDYNNRVKIMGTGTISNGSNRTIEVVVKKASVVKYGIFGDVSVDIKASGSVYSYDSSITPAPGPGDSTGEGDIGSNQSVIIRSGALVDGDVGLGDDGAGNEASFTDLGGTVNGVVSDVDRQDPDPLGAAGGSLAADIVNAAITNDNANAPEIGVDLTIDETTTLTAGDYYVECINLGMGDDLTIAPGTGTINIYMPTNGCVGNKIIDVALNANVFITGNPTQFNVFTASSDSITFKNGTDFYGTMYAPYANVIMQNSANVYGLIFGQTVEMKNSGDFYFDRRILDTLTTDDIEVVSWREITN